VGLKDARDGARTIRARVALGENPQASKRQEKAAAKAGRTLAEVCDRFVREHARDKLRAWEQGDYLRKTYVLPKLGNRRIDDITRADIRATFGELTNEKKRPVLANQVLAAVSAVLSWAMGQDIIPLNVAKGIKRNATTSRERVLADKEIKSVWGALVDVPGPQSIALKVLLLTGQRPGEVRHMRWRDIERGEFRLTDNSNRARKAKGAWWTLPGEPDDGWPGVKNHRTHRVWLTPACLDLIDRRADENKISVFAGVTGQPISPDTLGGAFKKACKAANIDPANRPTPHDLRRTHGTAITAMGFGRDAMNRTQNHAEGGIAGVYDQHSYAFEMYQIQTAVGTRFMAIAEGRDETRKVVELNAKRHK